MCLHDSGCEALRFAPAASEPAALCSCLCPAAAHHPEAELWAAPGGGSGAGGGSLHLPGRLCADPRARHRCACIARNQPLLPWLCTLMHARCAALAHAASNPFPRTLTAAYGLTLVWALVAVFEHTDSTPVHRTALAAIIVLAILSVASVLRRPGARQPESGHDHEARQPLRPSLDEP